MIIRSAKLEEANSLSSLAMRSKGHWGYSDDFMALCKAELTYTSQDLQNDLFYVLEVQSIRGFYALSKSGEHTIEIEALFVNPADMGKGYGNQLMIHALNKARNLGAHQVTVVADPNAATFYQRYGAHFIGNIRSGSIKGRLLPSFHIDLGKDS